MGVVVAEIVVVLLLIGLNALFALSELGLVSSNRARLAVLERKGVPGAAQARLLAEDPQLFLPTVQVGITLVSILSGVFGAARFADQLTPVLSRAGLPPRAATSLSLTSVVLLITFLTLVLGELVPKQLALRQPERVAAVVARPLMLLSRFTAPIVWLLGRSTALVLRLAGAHRPVSQTVTEEELHALLAEGEQTGVIETEERGMIERVLRLADKPVRAIMTPRNNLAWIDRTDTPAEIAATLQSEPHSRLVICDGGVDNPVGVVLAKDLLNLLLEGHELSIAEALRAPIVIPDTVTALDALERLRTDALGLALVMDEYGSFEGVVTAADVLQAITGEPEPEASPAREAATAAGLLALDGKMPVDELKSRLHLPDLPAEGSYHTLAGLILALLRRVPRAGDRIVFGGWLFEVVAMDGRRVDRVQASREALAEG
jgi:putative hemolysin